MVMRLALGPGRSHNRAIEDLRVDHMKKVLLGFVVAAGILAGGCAGETTELASDAEMPFVGVCAAGELECADFPDPDVLLCDGPSLCKRAYGTSVICWSTFNCDRALDPADQASALPVVCEETDDDGFVYVCRWPAVEGLPSVPLTE